MYLLLLVFGGLLSAAGVVLVGSGVSLRDGAFDATILTPGIVAAAGGLLLIGLGAGLRTLQRIERTLASRPMPRALPIAEGAKASESVETSREPARILFAPKAVPESQPTVVLRNKSPEATFPADKISPVVPEIAISAAHDASAEINAHRTGSNGNGAASTRTGLHLSVSLRRLRQTNDKAKRPSTRCGRKAHVRRVPSKRLPFRRFRAPACLRSNHSIAPVRPMRAGTRDLSR